MVEVRLENVTHSYDGKTNAIEDINITFRDKSANALLGPSGCGKTTILKILTGLLTPTEGRVYFGDQDITEMPPEKRNVAIVFQFPVVYSMSVLQNLLFPLLNVKMPKEDKMKKALEAADALGLKPFLHESATKLGPAGKQRVALGRLLVREPTMFLFDEPLSSIEPEERSLLRMMLKKVQRTLGQTSIFVTHDQTEALTFADNVAVMDMGKIVQFDTIEGTYRKPNTAFVGFFIGSPGMNIIEGRLKEDEVDLKDFTIKIPREVSLPKGITEVKVGIRPEHIEASRDRKEGWIPFKSEGFEDSGKGFGILHLSTKNYRIKVRSTFPVSPGSNVWVHFPSHQLHFFDPEGKRISS